MLKSKVATRYTAKPGWRARVYEIIFGWETPSGKAFDIALFAAICVSVLIVMVESVERIRTGYGPLLTRLEWFLTIAFTIEYVLRLVCIREPVRYATSFFGIVDLLAIVPTYLSVLVPGAQALIVVRLLRILRVFRVLKLVQFLSEADLLLQALKHSVRKITVFVFTVVTLVTILGSLMYLVEGGGNGFTSIPKGVYWAIVTLTTVGYGDISPQTDLGQFLAALVMILGYAIIAVPTGIVTAELVRRVPEPPPGMAGQCSRCKRSGHAADAVFCKYCGADL